MNKANQIYNLLYRSYGNIPCPLEYNTNFQLMIAVILSAQCTDKAVNKITPALFNNFPDAPSLAEAGLSEVENIIYPLGLYRMKAKNIILCAKELIKNYNSIIPDSISKLIKLPGIGRKSANVVISHAFNKPGFAVDTHVKRILNRTGVVDTKNPDRIEALIRKTISPEKLSNFSLLLIMHGRQCCKSQKPHCPKCIINNKCDFNKLNNLN
ncbi:MAG: endonuclease III [Victivallales bacterium]|nr:endonuclease III [Victivallales bacterium]